MDGNNFLKSSQAFLGRGWAFPPSFNKGNNAVAMVEGEADINSSLSVLLNTAVGERVMQTEYGANVSRLVFEPLNTTFATFITEQIRTAILYFEPRITLDSIDYGPEAVNGRVDVTINYTIKGTNTRANIVYPFYINEGTDVSNG